MRFAVNPGHRKRITAVTGRWSEGYRPQRWCFTISAESTWKVGETRIQSMRGPRSLPVKPLDPPSPPCAFTWLEYKQLAYRSNNRFSCR